MRDRYDAIVIGTGFGGAVASCRLAQAGLRVGILERGRRYDRPDPANGGRFPYPRDFANLDSGWLYAKDQGLFDVKPVEEVFVFQGAGYGGGSLIYANVHLRPVPDVFDSGWPKGYSREALNPYYDLVAYMLDINPITVRAPAARPPKTKAMADAITALGRSAQLYYPNLAVNLADPGQDPRPNKFGVPQQGCRDCGECDIGCLYGAKNTLDLNYLAVAERKGADVGTQCEVRRIERSDGGYVVTYMDFPNGGPRRVTASAVFVCAGAVNSTELLLRCRDDGALPDLSPALGEGYSGNGDFLAFGFDTQSAVRPDFGPTITTGVIFDRGKGDLRTWFTLQEGGYPKQLGAVFQLLREGSGWWPAAGNLVREEVDCEIRKAMSANAGTMAAGTANSAVFLAMGRDRADGRLELHPLTKQLCVLWNLAGNLPLYDTEDRLVRDVVERLGGNAAVNPLWKLLAQPVSVHNLGGCRMADDPQQGVTDGNGEVHGYPNLFVLDGGCLPSSTGVNPSHTIAAVAERNVEAFIRRTKDPRWSPPERKDVVAVEDPLTRVTIPAGGTAPTKNAAVGLSFTETMRGFLCPADSLPASLDGYLAAEQRAKDAGQNAQFTLTITTSDLDRFLVDALHAAQAVGDVIAPPRTPQGGARVTAGVFNLFIVDGPRRRKMVYSLPFVGADGRPYLLDGFKDVVDDGKCNVWPATSTLYTVIRSGKTHDDPVCAAGVLRIEDADFLRQLMTFQFPGATSQLAKIEAMTRFARMFLGNLWDVFKPRLFGR